MAILSFKLGHLFILQVPGLIVGLPFVVACCTNFPNEPDFVQQFLSINWNFVSDMISTLVTNPSPKRHVFPIPFGHETMVMLSFKLDKLFIPLIPFFILRFPHGSQQLRFVLPSFCFVSSLCCLLPFIGSEEARGLQFEQHTYIQLMDVCCY
jgi:hypothetical protein